jgi:CheY-like chemotaxis protein
LSVAEIEQAAQRAAELTRQLLAYAGKGRFVVEPVDCSLVVREMTALLRTAVSKNAQVNLSLADSLPPVEADVTQLRQVVMNLITNASDALPEHGGLIHIHTGLQQVDADYLATCVPGSDTMPGSFVFVEVRDDGRGMDEATRTRIFDPFFTTKFTGRGLGLAATLGIMRGHKGAIRVYSEPGVGTSVKLLFPAGVGTISTPVVSPPAAWKGSGEVLVVDDEPSVRAVSRALLRRRGFTVTEASGGREAVALVTEDPSRFRLVLLDLTMPDMGGEATFRALRQVAPLLKVILMSGYNEQEVTRQFVGRGLAAFLQKPFRAEELDNAARKVLGEGAPLG